MAFDPRKPAIVAVTTTTVGAWDASSFADALLKHEKLLMPQGAGSMSLIEQATKLKNNAPHLQKIASIWEKNHGVMDGFANALNNNPDMLKKFREIAVKDGADGQMNSATGLFSRYSQGGWQELQKAINVQHRQFYPDQYQARPEKPATDKPASTRLSEPTFTHNSGSSSRQRTEPVAPALQDQNSEPAPATIRPPVTSPPATPSQAAVTKVDGDTANIIAQTAIGSVGSIFGTEFKKEEDLLKERLQNEPELRQSIADAINKDPELLKQLNGTGGGAGEIAVLAEGFDKRPPAQQEVIRNAFREPYKQLLQDPTLIGDPSFRTNIAKSVVGAVPITADMVGREDGLIDKMTDKLRTMYPDLVNDIDTFEKKIKGDDKLQKQIADNLNNNPEFVGKMMSFGGEQDSGFMSGIMKMVGKGTVKDLLANPAQLASDSYVDSLSSKLDMGGGGGILGSIMKFVQGFIDMIAPLFQKGMAAAQEGLSMANSGEGLFGKLGEMFGFSGDNNLTSVDPKTGQTTDPETRRRQQERDREATTRAPNTPPKTPQQNASLDQPSPGTGPGAPTNLIPSGAGF